MKDVAAQILRTFALVGVLAILLYTGILWLVELPGVQFWVTIAVCGIGLALLLSDLSAGMRDGAFHYRIAKVERQTQPLQFWTHVALSLLCAVLLALLLIWSLAQLI